MNSVQIDFANEILELRPQRTVWWQRMAMLFVADLHLGANESTDTPIAKCIEKLDRLDSELSELPAQELCILGDLVHATIPSCARFECQLRKLRDKYRHQKWLLIEGNHDCRWRQSLREISIDVQTPPFYLAPFWLMHDAAKESLLIPHELGVGVPPEVTNRNRTHVSDSMVAPMPCFSLSAHLHPCVRTPGKAPTVKSHCFWVQPSHIILPSFADERATRCIQPQASDRVYLVS